MKTVEAYVAEISSYKCLYCRTDYPNQSSLGMVASYRHPEGLSTRIPTEFGDRLELRWWYGVCDRCKYQWALWKLRDADTNDW